MDLPTIYHLTLRSATAGCALWLAAVLCCAPGCRTLEPPADLAASLSSADAPESLADLPHIEPPVLPDGKEAFEEPVIPEAMSTDAWVVALPETGIGDDFPYYWQHPGLDRLVALPPGERPDFSQYLTCDDPVVGGNAMIMLARAGDDSVDRCLIETVRNTDLKLPMRRAAAEALSILPTLVAAPALGELLDDFRNAPDDKPLAPLHAEVLRGLARHTDPSATPYFAAALKSPHAEIREAALYAYTINTKGALPSEVVELRNDTDPRVRAATLSCLTARRHPQALEFAQTALTDFHLDVRLSAIESLGRLGGAEARTTLEKLLLHDPEMVRSAAITALAEAGDDVTVFASAKDPLWQVRRSVARSLFRFPSPRGAAIARQLLADGSTEVRRAVLLSIDAWPIELAGPIFLTAMAEAPLPTRQQAVAELAARWAPAARYPADAPSDVRTAEMKILRADFERIYPPIDLPADEESASLPGAAGAAAIDLPGDVAPLDAAAIDSLPAGIEPYGAVPLNVALEPSRTVLASHHEVLSPGEQAAPQNVAVAAPAVAGSTVEAVHQLGSGDPAVRRAAAKLLADSAAAGQLDIETLARICTHGATESDAGVWYELLRAVKADNGDASLEMAIVGSTHTAADVRRLSCAYLGMRADPRATDALLRAINDPHRAVVRSALEALAVPGAVVESAPLERLLTSDDKTLRVAAARTLAVNRFTAGSAALVALTRDDDAEVRRQAAAAMGMLHDPAFLGTLIQLLDDDLNVRLAAITSLTLIAGRDVNITPAGSAPPLADQVRGWRQWWEAEGNRVAELNRPNEAGSK